MTNMANSTPKNQARSGLFVMRRYAPVGLALCLGVVLSFASFHFMREQEQARIQAEFNRQASTYAAALQKSIDNNIEVLDSISGLFAASTKVDREDFQKFVTGPLSRHPEIQAI